VDVIRHHDPRKQFVSIAVVELKGFIHQAANRWPAQKIIHSFLYPHILNALIVGALIIYVGLRVISKHPTIQRLRKPAHALLGLLVFQLLLGFVAFVTRMQGADELQPTGTLVATTVAHMGVGALILAFTVILTIQAYRHTQDQTEEQSPAGVAGLSTQPVRA